MGRTGLARCCKLTGGCRLLRASWSLFCVSVCNSGSLPVKPLCSAKLIRQWRIDGCRLCFRASSDFKCGGDRPSLPAGVRIYAVGDIHGRLDLLNELLARIDADIALRPTVRAALRLSG